MLGQQEKHWNFLYFNDTAIQKKSDIGTNNAVWIF